MAVGAVVASNLLRRRFWARPPCRASERALGYCNESRLERMVGVPGRGGRLGSVELLLLVVGCQLLRGAVGCGTCARTPPYLPSPTLAAQPGYPRLCLHVFVRNEQPPLLTA